MSASVIVECGAAATRAARIEDDIVVQFWFGPARGDEHLDMTPRIGRHFIGKVTAIDKSLNAAFVDIGDGRDSFLALNKKNAASITDGAMIAAVIKSPPRQDKGAVIKLIGEAPAGSRAPGRLAPAPDAALEAVQAIGAGAEKIITDQGAVRSVLIGAAVEGEIIAEQHSLALFDAYGAEDALEGAFERIAPLAEGGRLVIDEAHALTAIDVDTGRLRASSPTRLREKIATSAAREAALQVRRRNIGGHIVIDFPPISANSARERFDAALKKAIAAIDGAGAGSFSRSGLYSFTAPHHGQSLLEQFTEPCTIAPQPGRVFNLDWQAKTAIRMLEHRLRAAPKVHCMLEMGSALMAHISGHAAWTGRLEQRYGSRFTLRGDDKREGRDFELTEQ